jgi:hypothetical protein
MTPNRYKGYKVCLRLKRNHLKISFQCLKMRSDIVYPDIQLDPERGPGAMVGGQIQGMGVLGVHTRFLDNLDLRCAQLLAHLVALLVPQWLCQLGPQLVPQLLALLLAQLVAPQVWGPKGRDECVKIKL